jgi:hypothetical protein
MSFVQAITTFTIGEAAIVILICVLLVKVGRK